MGSKTKEVIGNGHIDLAKLYALENFAEASRANWEERNAEKEDTRSPVARFLQSGQSKCQRADYWHSENLETL